MTAADNSGYLWFVTDGWDRLLDLAISTRYSIEPGADAKIIIQILAEFV